MQTEYSLWSREPEDGLLKLIRELGIGFVSYSPLGRGFLTGQYKKFEDLPTDDYRRNSPRFQGENFAKNIALVQKLEALALEKKCTTAQLALAWVLAQGRDIVTIPGTKSARRLKENMGACEIQLSAKDLSFIEHSFPKGSAVGNRYPDMSTVNR